MHLTVAQTKCIIILYKKKYPRGGTMKNKLLTVLIVIAMLIPGIIAVANYTYLKNTPIEYRNLSRVDITDLSGERFELAHGQDDATNRALDFFVSMNRNARSVDALPQELSEASAFTFTYYSYQVKTDYQYYFSLSPDNAYYVNDKGAAYKITAADATSFLCTAYARSLYGDNTPPVLTLSDAAPVIPSAIKWTFRDVDSQYVDYASAYETTKSVSSYEMASNFGMKFSREPDYFYVTISQNDTTLYQGEYGSLTLPAALDLDQPATVEVSAEWYESVDHIYAGSATYRFYANLVPPPSFSLISSDGDYAEQGSMLILTGKNIKNPSDITVTSSPDIEYTPKWFSNSETGSVYALIPIPIADYQEVDSFTFTVSSGGSSSTLSVPYQANKFSTLSGLAEATFDSEFEAISAQIADPSDGAIYFDGTFVNPVRDTAGLKGYGRMVDGTYRHNGVDFTNVNAGDSVSCGAAGTVAYIGNLTTGQSLVVIEHGLGLRSWYVNLGSVSAELSIGAQVEKGASIGTCGGGSLHCSFTVFDKPVSPYKFWAFTPTDNPDYLKLS